VESGQLVPVLEHLVQLVAHVAPARLEVSQPGENTLVEDRLVADGRLVVNKVGNPANQELAGLFDRLAAHLAKGAARAGCAIGHCHRVNA
jgi:hypothetical protein